MIALLYKKFMPKAGQRAIALSSRGSERNPIRMPPKRGVVALYATHDAGALRRSGEMRPSVEWP
jgi:hypothetical protein